MLFRICKLILGKSDEEMVSDSNLGIFSRCYFGSGLRPVLDSLSCVLRYRLHRFQFGHVCLSIANSLFVEAIYDPYRDHDSSHSLQFVVLHFWRGWMVDRPVLFGEVFNLARTLWTLALAACSVTATAARLKRLAAGKRKLIC